MDLADDIYDACDGSIIQLISSILSWTIIVDYSTGKIWHRSLAVSHSAQTSGVQHLMTPIFDPYGFSEIMCRV